MRRENALVIGIANEDSISSGIAGQLFANGYNIMPTYLNEKALPHVKAVRDRLAVDTLFPFQVGNAEQLQAIIDHMKEQGLRLDAVVHGIAFATLTVSVLENTSVDAMIYPIDTGVDIMGI